jgi:hypothetical protein
MTIKRSKIAVVFTHGIGGQIPMGTLDEFVAAARVNNSAAQYPAPADERPEDIWFKPDPTTNSLELRRVTTVVAAGGRPRREGAAR